MEEEEEALLHVSVTTTAGDMPRHTYYCCG